MKSLNLALKELKTSKSFTDKSRIVWTGTHYTVSYFYSPATLERLGWEIIK